MEGAQLRRSWTPRLVAAFALIALTAGVLAPSAGATSPSEDQYGSALPGVGGGKSGGGSGGSTSGGGGGGGEATIPVAGDSSPSGQGTAESGGTNASGGTGSGSSNAQSNGGSSSAQSNGGSSSGDHERDAKTGPGDQSGNNHVSGQNTSHGVPQIAADSAGDGWVPFFIAGLVALAAAAAFLLYRNRRRAAQP